MNAKLLNAKLLDIDIQTNGVSNLATQIEIDIVNEVENQTNEILSELLDELIDFAQITMEYSSTQEQLILSQMDEQPNSPIVTGGEKQTQDSYYNYFKIIENKSFSKIMDNKAAPIEDSTLQRKARDLSSIKEEIKEALNVIEIEKASVENEITLVENSIEEFQRKVEVERTSKESIIKDLNNRLQEYIKTIEQKKLENSLLINETILLKETIETLKKTYSDIENQNKVLSAEIKIGRREHEFFENKFLNERNELLEKIDILQKKLDAALKEKLDVIDAVKKADEKAALLESELQVEKTHSIEFKSEVAELKAELDDIKKQKQLLISNKLNNNLQFKRETYTEKKPVRFRLMKYAALIISVIAIIIAGYFVFDNYYSPLVEKQKALKGEIAGLNTQLEQKNTYIDTMSIEQRHLTAKLEELTQQVKFFEDKVGENLTKLEKTQISMIENQKNFARNISIPLGAISSSSSSTGTLNSLTQKSSEIIVNKPASTPPTLSNKLVEMVYFDSGSSFLNEKEVNKIKLIAEQYNRNPYIFIRLEGHTDDKMFRVPLLNQYSNNHGLSIARAAEVSRILVQYGMDIRQISIVGLGDIYPLVPNDNPENREKNRRVEIKVTDNSKQFN